MNYSNKRAAAVTLPVEADGHGWAVRRLKNSMNATRDGVLIHVTFTATGSELSTDWVPLSEATETAGLRPPARVISGDVESVTAALDGLPVGSIITCEGAGGGLVYHRCEFPQSRPAWFESGRVGSVPSAHIARHQVPITVLREGTGA